LSKQDLFGALWVERYRPSTLADLVLGDEDRSSFENMIKEKEIPHLLFCGPAGTGKTTLAKILVKELDAVYRYINASDERGIDAIRDKIVPFAQTKSIDGKLKIIILDECLDENTLVTILRDGILQQIKIKDLDQNNDLVKTYNFKTNKIEFRPFYHIDKGIQDVYEIEFENKQIIICTGSHKWYVKTPDGDIVRMKLEEMIEKNITEIITKTDGFITD
jgi:DNA polymerase III delta prime subunit